MDVNKYKYIRPRLHHTRQFFCPDEYSCRDTLRLHSTTLSAQVWDRKSLHVFNLLRKCTSTGQILVMYRGNVTRDEYLRGSICFRFLFKAVRNTSFKAMRVIFVGTAMCNNIVGVTVHGSF